MDQRGEAEDENEKPEDDGKPILVEQGGGSVVLGTRKSVT